MENAAEQQLCAAAGSGDCSKLRELLDSGADASFFDADGLTPLMHAAKHGHADAVRLLLEFGAPWNALSPSGLSAGDLAMDLGHQDAFDVILNFAVQAELVLASVQRHVGKSSTHEYLNDRVAFSEDKIVDADSKAVMMKWERPLMEAHARAVCGNGDGGKILNVGFGMGLVDEAIQRYNPGEHTIIEAHPDVYDRMIKSGWGKKENVKIMFGRWQDVLLQLDSYDGIFFDTYSEHYEDLRGFHQHLPKLLKPGGIYSYFNGLCADNAFFHVVYCQLVALELGNLGFSTQFVPLPVEDCLAKEVWEGVKHKYWQLDTYHLPVCQAASSD